MEEARLAGEDDVGALATLARAAIAELATLRGGAVWKAREARAEPLEDAFLFLLKDEDARVLVASIDEAPLGYAVARVERLGDGSTLGVIDDIYVDAEARGVGLGEAMMADLMAWCGDRGCFGMDALALPGDRSTKNFFEGSGFTARQLIMHHSLTAGGASEAGEQ